MKKIIPFAFMFLFLIACSQKPTVAPVDILNEKEMTTILTDLHIAQSSLNNREKNEPNGTQDEYLELILKNHHTTRDKFLKSLKFYAENPEMLNGVYEDVMLRLNSDSLE